MGVVKSNGYRNKHTRFHKVISINKHGKDCSAPTIKHEEGWFEKLVHKFLTHLSR